MDRSIKINQKAITGIQVKDDGDLGQGKKYRGGKNVLIQNIFWIYQNISDFEIFSNEIFLLECIWMWKRIKNQGQLKSAWPEQWEK